MPNQIQRNRAQEQRANDPQIDRDHEQLGADGERQRRANRQDADPPRDSDDAEE